MLRFREKKALLQEKMIRENPGAVIVSLGMNIPGPVKSGPMIYAAFREGLERLEELSGKKKGMRTVKVLMEEAAGYAAVCLTKEQDSSGGEPSFGKAVGHRRISGQSRGGEQRDGRCREEDLPPVRP